MERMKQSALSPQELADQLLSEHTPGPWRVGKYPTTVVSDSKIETTRKYPGNPPDGGVNDVNYYGGSLIAESLLRIENAKLIAAAPTMYEVLTKLIRCKNEDELDDIIDSARNIINDVNERVK